jgi:hypothetical protein
VFQNLHLMLVFQVQRRETDTGQAEITVALEPPTPWVANGSGGGTAAAPTLYIGFHCMSVLLSSWVVVVLLREEGRCTQTSGSCAFQRSSFKLSTLLLNNKIIENHFSLQKQICFIETHIVYVFGN